MQIHDDYGRPIVAHCKKCGRGFLSIGSERPERDPYYPAGTWPTKSNPDVDICNGVIDYFELLPLQEPERRHRQYGKLVAHLAGAFVATVAFAAVTLVDPELLRWVLALIVAGNCVAAAAAYMGVY